MEKPFPYRWSIDYRMDIGIVGGGINGLCCAWKLARQGHRVRLYERDTIMSATSRASSKLLHGGLRYLENGEFRLVREALHERDAWIHRVPNLAKPLRLIMPIYKNSRRNCFMVGAGLFLYDHLAGKSALPGAKWLKPQAVLERSCGLKEDGLIGGYAFSDGQMDDHALGLWVAQQARQCGAEIKENIEILRLGSNGEIVIATDQIETHDRLINIAGPWAAKLNENSGIATPYQLDLVRGSHLILEQPCSHALMLEVPSERRIVFILPWKGQTLLGTTEVRQSLDAPIVCSQDEQTYLLNTYQHYFPDSNPEVIETFSGLRPLLYSAKDPNKATREYAIHRTDKLITVLGGKWTTAMALAKKVSLTLHE